MDQTIIITDYLERPLIDYIREENCARRGRCNSYLDTAKRLEIPQEHIEQPKRFREEPTHQLSRQEIETYVLGKTLRRPCFDLMLMPDGSAKCSWIDSLDDTEQKLAWKIRNRLGLTHRPDESFGVPVYQKGTWVWDQDGRSIIRNFGSCYPTPFKTEFFFQKNGLLSIKSHNINLTIWYDLFVFNSDQVLDHFGVSWSEIEAYTNVASNNQREISANAFPQHKQDSDWRAG